MRFAILHIDLKLFGFWLILDLFVFLFVPEFIYKRIVLFILFAKYLLELVLGTKCSESIFFGFFTYFFRPSSMQVLIYLKRILTQRHSEYYGVKRVTTFPERRTSLGEPLLQYFAVFVDRLR